MNVYKLAIDVQDASNISGVVNSLSEVIQYIRDNDPIKGNAYLNSHPAIVLFVSKLSSFTGGDSQENFSGAYSACKKAIEHAAIEADVAGMEGDDEDDEDDAGETCAKCGEFVPDDDVTWIEPDGSAGQSKEAKPYCNNGCVPPEGEECDECGNLIPPPIDDNDRSIVNRHHKTSCSLYPHNDRELT